MHAFHQNRDTFSADMANRRVLVGLVLVFGFFLLTSLAVAHEASSNRNNPEDDFVAPYNPEYNDGVPEEKLKSPASKRPAAAATSAIKTKSAYSFFSLGELFSSPKQPEATTLRGKMQNGMLQARKSTWYWLERKDVRSFKSILLMVDVLFVMVSIQSQLDAGRERLVDYAIANKVERVHSAQALHGIVKHVQSAPKGKPSLFQAGVSHMQKARLFRKEELFTIEASLTILSTLLIEKMARIWARHEKWYRKTSEVVDLGVLAVSIGLEWVFHQMEHDGSLRSIKGSVLRWVAENWRFVRIVHGSYETLAHSPIIRPLLHNT